MIDIQYRSAVQLVRAIDAFGAQPSGGLIVGPATTRIDAGTILELAAQYRLPTIHANREFAENGGLISYGGNPLALWARASFFVDRILRGAKVSELPVEFPMSEDVRRSVGRNVQRLRIKAGLSHGVPAERTSCPCSSKYDLARTRTCSSSSTPWPLHAIMVCIGQPGLSE